LAKVAARIVWAGLLLAAALELSPANAQEAAPLRGSDAAAEGPADALPDVDAAPDPAATPDPAAAPRPAAKTRKRRPHDLPPTQPYPGAQRLGLRGGAEPAPDAEPAPTIAALPKPPAPRRIKREDKPFDPVGLYVGDLKLTPYVEQSLGYASNPLGISGARKGSPISVSEIGVGLQSNWSRNELTGSAKLGYNDYFQLPSASAPYGSGVVDYRLDASRDLTFDTEGRFNVASETGAQLGLGGNTTGALTLVSTYGATGGVINKFGDFSIGLHGTVDRVQYQGGELDTDDYTGYGLKLRTSYRWTEAVQPFAEVDGDVRVYDQTSDANGYDRASDGIAGRAGLRLALSEMVTGEADVGYGARAYRDPRLQDVATPLFDASMIWSVTPLTTVTFKAASALNDAVVAGASSDINRSYTINLDHALTERIKLGLSAGYSTDHYVGPGNTDRSYTLGATAEYHMSREIVLKASATHTQFAPGSGSGAYNSDTVLVGVRLQR
jgi:hypothetical protein